MLTNEIPTVDEQAVNEVATEGIDSAQAETGQEPIMDLGSLEIEFGVPSYAARAPRVSKNNEKYPNKAVLTMFAAPTEAKKAYRFELNSTAEKLLGLEGAKAEKQEHVAFSFKVAGHLLLINVTEDGDARPKGSINYTKSSTFSDKPSHETLGKTLNMDVTVDNEFELAVVNHSKYKIVNLTLMNVEKSTAEAGELNIPEASENY